MPTPDSFPLQRYLPYLAALMFVSICAFHLLSARAGHPLYRDIHLGTAQVYARDGIDLFKPIIVGFNATQTPTPQELPLWQAATALAFKVAGHWLGWANVVSLLCFGAGLWPVFFLARSVLGRIGAWWTMLFFLMQPLVWQQAGTAATDGLSITIALWFFYAGFRLLQTPTLTWFILSALLGALAAVSKIPFMMASGLGLGLLLVTQHRSSKVRWLMLGGVAVFSGICFLLWTRYTDSCIAQAEFGFVELRTSKNPAMIFWYFGDWAYRLNPSYWIKGAWRALNGLFGSFFLILPFAAAFLWAPKANLARLLFASAIVVTLIFSHLVLTHHHYYLMFCFPVALMMAHATIWVVSKLPVLSFAKQIALMGFILTALTASLIQGMILDEIALEYDPYPAQISQLVREHTEPGDKLLIQNGGWGGDILSRSDRQGLSIWDTSFLEDPATLHRLKELGYNKLVMISESPLLVALQESNPGQANYKRDEYSQHLLGKAKDWSDIYRSDELLIKKIP